MKESAVMAGKRQRKSRRKARPARAENRKNRECLCKISRTEEYSAFRSGAGEDVARTVPPCLTEPEPQLRISLTHPTMAQPVFYDPRQARWKRLRRLFDVVGIGFMLLVVFFIYNAVHGEPLPELSLSWQKKPFRALKDNEKG